MLNINVLHIDSKIFQERMKNMQLNFLISFETNESPIRNSIGISVASFQHLSRRNCTYLSDAIFRELSGCEWSIVCRPRVRRGIFRRSRRTLASSLARERAAALDRQRHE